LREVHLPAAEKSCVIHKCYPGTFHHVRVYAVGVDDSLIARSRRLTVQTSAPPQPPCLALRYPTNQSTHTPVWQCQWLTNTTRHHSTEITSLLSEVKVAERCQGSGLNSRHWDGDTASVKLYDIY